MQHRYTALALLTFAALHTDAQYCAPSFVNGCFDWHNQGMTLGTINWTAGSDCYYSDFTNLSTQIAAGVPEPMTVTSGNWTGCAVWVDLDNSGSFEDSENLYYSYVGGSPSYTYNFSITIPANTPAGNYRMRVIAPWGSDGFLSTNTNGYGPCGNFQYGNFNDFTLAVLGGTTGITERTSDDALTAGPNPCTDMLTVQLPTDGSLQRIVLLGPDGRVVRNVVPSGGSPSTQIDLADLPAGLYVAQGIGTDMTRTMRVVKL